MKRSTFLKLKLREARFITRALARTDHPVLAHIIPMRRCNLACTYCNEYDKTSDPVPLEAMKSRLRSEEHTSELQSQSNLVCRLLLEKKNFNEHVAVMDRRLRALASDVLGR